MKEERKGKESLRTISDEELNRVNGGSENTDDVCQVNRSLAACMAQEGCRWSATGGYCYTPGKLTII